MNKTVFISYSWAEPSGGIVNNWLKPSLKNAGIDVSVDKDDCHYQDSIEQYEQEIGNADKIIAVVSRPYLESINCMYEMALIFEKGGELNNRLYFVGIEKVQSIEDIINFWNKALVDVQNDMIGKAILQPYEKKKRKVDLILKHLGDFLDYWEDINRMDFSKVSEENFKVLTNIVIDRTNEAEMSKENLMLTNPPLSNN